MVEMQEVGNYYTTSGGIVIIYKITSTESFLDEFYVVSFDDTANEQPWGVGSTPVAALESAVKEWDRVSDMEEVNNNPFKEVLAQLQSS